MPQSKPRQNNLALPSNTSSRVSHSRPPMLSGLTELFAMNGYPSTTGITSMKSETSLPIGSGPSIMNAQKWPWAASHQNSG